MKKKLYLTPTVRTVTMDDGNRLVCTSDDQETLVKVDPLTEEYYGKDGDDDYLIKL